MHSVVDDVASIVRLSLSMGKCPAALVVMGVSFIAFWFVAGG